MRRIHLALPLGFGERPLGQFAHLADARAQCCRPVEVDLVARRDDSEMRWMARRPLQIAAAQQAKTLQRRGPPPAHRLAHLDAQPLAGLLGKRSHQRTPVWEVSERCSG